MRVVQESDEMQFGNFMRIEHVITKCWLRGEPGNYTQNVIFIFIIIITTIIIIIIIIITVYMLRVFVTR